MNNNSCNPLFLTILVFALLLPVDTVSAQSPAGETLASWVALDAPTGHEHWATDALLQRYDGWQKDRYGNLAKTVGQGAPHRVVACGLDAYAYAISQITEEGYLRLHRIGSGSRHPLWDQAHEGNQLRILTRSGPLVGVSAVANGHFAAQHAHETALITQNDLWLDVGAESAAEVAAMGINLLDPVTRHLPAWAYANEVAGPRAGSRVACAAVFAAAEAGVNGSGGSTSYVLSVQQVFGWTGLGAALSFLEDADELILVAPGQPRAVNEQRDTLSGRIGDRVAATSINRIHYLAPQVNDADALMERITLNAAQRLLVDLVATINASASTPDWQPAPEQAEVMNNDRSRWGNSANLDRLIAVESTLDAIAEQYAVPGHEGPVRNIVYNELPGWAQDIAQTDAMGNLWVEFGPQGPATVFVAHMDEVGYEVESIESDGRINLLRRGGVVETAWEGQPAVLQLDANSDIDSSPNPPLVRGVFLARANPETKRPRANQAWFGMNSEQLRGAGIVPGMGLTIYKQGHRLGPFRYGARSMDDRVGSASLLMALQQIDPETVQSPMIFAWSVREEGGLLGATELASKLGSRTRRVYSIDTFVTSDTPLESPHFAYAPLGEGPVLRSVENSGLAIPYELDRNRRIASEAGIDAQIGLTQGSTDGTAFTFYGAPNAGLSWPGRYSHSPAEIADLRDIAELVDLITAIALAPAGP